MKAIVSLASAALAACVVVVLWSGSQQTPSPVAVQVADAFGVGDADRAGDVNRADVDGAGDTDGASNRLTGLVLDRRSGAPISGATVAIYPERWADGERDTVRVRTDAAGWFGVAGLHPGHYVAEAMDATHQVALSHATSVPRLPGARPLALYLDEGAAIRGIVLDADGRLVPSARVAAQYSGAEPGCSADFVTTMSDGDGQFELLGLRVAEYSVTAEAPGRARARAASRAPRGASEPLRLQFGRLAELEVTLTVDGAPFAGRVLVSTDAPGFPRVLLSPADGRLVIPGLEPGVRQIELRPDGFAPAYLDEPRLRDGQRAAGGAARLARGRTVRGRVVDRGRPVAGALVALRTRLEATLPVETDARGRFAIDGCTDQGTFELLVSAPRGSASTVAGPDDESIEIELQAPADKAWAEVTLATQVVDVTTGKPFPAYTLLTSYDRVTRDGIVTVSRRFHVTKESGPVTLHDFPTDRSASVDVDAPGVNSGGSRESTIAVTVVDESGAPVGGARVVAVAEHPDRDPSGEGAGAAVNPCVARARTGPDGRVLIEELSQAPHTVQVEADQYARALTHVVVEGTEPLPLTVHLMRGGTIRGRVLAPCNLPDVPAQISIGGVMPAEPAPACGAPLAGWHVFIARPGATWANAMVDTDAGGRFAAPHLPAGEYTVSPVPAWSSRPPVHPPRTVSVHEGEVVEVPFS